MNIASTLLRRLTRQTRRRPGVTRTIGHCARQGMVRGRSRSAGWCIGLPWVATLVLSGVARAEVPPMPDPVAAYGPEADYTIYRNGKQVGEHQMRFSATGNQLQVDIESALTVRVLKIPVFRFRYTSTERWLDGHLQAVTATTRQGGDETSVSLESNDETSRLQNEDGKQQIPRLDYASNHWMPAVLQAERVFNTLTGKASRIRVEKLGSKRFRTGSGMVQAQHFRYTGDVEAESWYDESGRWIGLRFQGRDDSTITYRADF